MRAGRRDRDAGDDRGGGIRGARMGEAPELRRASGRSVTSRTPRSMPAPVAFAAVHNDNPKELELMGLFSKDIKTLDDLFMHGLQDIYYAEQQITKALPKMIDKASDPQLKQAFQSHLRETEEHVRMVERVFSMLGRDPKGETCPAIDGIIDEAEDIAGDVEDPQVLDAALLAAAQAVEHYEITRYGTLIAWAKQLGRQDSADVLQRILEQEKAADQKLNRIAESKVNVKAA
jgi:ferritin-like metal-binding protein YciE